MKKELNGITYELIDPTGNITILVRSLVAPSDMADVSQKLMEHEKTCEQVGYVSDSDKCDIKLYMTAGEFCGNATMSAAALYCDDVRLVIGDKRTVTVDASGCDHPVEVVITRRDDSGRSHIYDGSVDMPRPLSIKEETLIYMGNSYTLPVVYFDGIVHAIADKPLGLNDEDLKCAIIKWCEDIGSKCMGIMLLSGDEELFVRPLVYVTDPGTCFWEHSCASGTSAVGAYLAKKTGNDISVKVREPGGILTVTAQKKGHILLAGSVRI